MNSQIQTNHLQEIYFTPFIIIISIFRKATNSTLLSIVFVFSFGRFTKDTNRCKTCFVRVPVICEVCYVWEYLTNVFCERNKHYAFSKFQFSNPGSKLWKEIFFNMLSTFLKFKFWNNLLKYHQVISSSFLHTCHCGDFSASPSCQIFYFISNVNLKIEFKFHCYYI